GSDSTFRVNVSFIEINFDNVTFNLLNGSNVNINGTKFNGSSNRAINFTGLVDGVYRLNVTVVDYAKNTNTSEQRTFTIDTTRPLITYETNINSLINNSNWSQSTFYLNVSYTETNFDNATFNLLNSSTANINGTKFNGSTNRAINFSGLADGAYRLNITVVDLANNSNTSNQLTFTIDTTRPLITYEANGLINTVNNTYWGSDSSFRVNVSFTETNFDNVTFNLLNSSNVNVNGTKYNASTERALNFTSLVDGVYRLNVTAVDTANNTNSSEQRTFTIDTTRALIVYAASGTNDLSNNTNWSQSEFRVNVTYTETNFDNVTFNLLNSSTANINGTKFNGSSNRAINFSGLADGTYRLNVTVVDLANNSNTSNQLTFTIDTTRPLITYEANGLINTANNSYWGSDSTFRVNVSYTEVRFDNVTFNLLNSSNANINGTKYNISTERALNFTGLADGVYRLNVTVVDNANNTNTSEQRTFTIDTTRSLITFVETANHSLANNTNISASVIRVNVSYTETNFDNVTFNLLNSSNANINGTKFNGSTNRAINFSDLADGVYRLNVTVVDLANNSNTSDQRTIRIDTTRPLVNHTTATVGNNSNLTVATFIMNVSVTEINFANMTFIVANASNGSQIFNTTTLVDATRLFMSYTVNGDGNYTVNVTVTDTANNRNMTVNQFVTVDVTPPVIVFSLSPTTLTPVEAVTIGGCSAVDRMDPGVGGALSIKKPGQSSYSSVSAGSYTDTNGEGTYTVRCTSQDYAGNSVTLEKTFSVGAGGSSGGSSGGGGGKSSLAKDGAVKPVKRGAAELEETPVSIDSAEVWDIEGSVQYSAIAGEVYTFSFVSVESGLVGDHNISISSVDEENGTVTLIIESTPQEITLAIGESKEIDLDEDSVTDLLVTLNGITDGLADVTFAKLGVWIEPESVTSYEGDTVRKSYLWIWISAGVIVLALVVLLLVRIFSKKAIPVVAKGRRR
ncbi:MAG: Ig-like domain-containing protein, partial [bacterium]|nr:Ig-like domain-containing protein [bacterium]